MSEQTPKEGVCCVLLADGKVLLGQRLSTDGRGTWSLPGGKVDPNEEPIRAAVREVKEETTLALHIAALTFVQSFRSVSSDTGEPWLTHVFVSNLSLPEKELLALLSNPEKDKFALWQYWSLNALPQPLFQPTVMALQAAHCIQK